MSRTGAWRRLLVGLLTVLLAGCASTAGLTTHEELLSPDQVQAARSLAGLPLSDAAWPARDWWLALGDRQLDALVHEALAHNPELAIALARARQATARAGLAEAGRLPTLGAKASVSGAHLPGTLLPPPLGGHFGWVRYGALSFQWDLDLWGGKRAAWEAAVDQAHAAAVDARAARLVVSVNVARAWAQLGHAGRRLALADEELQRAREARKLTRQRVSAGIDSQLQARRADAEVAMATRQQLAAARSLDAARIALAVLLGRGPDRTADLAPPAPLDPLALALPSDLPAALLGRRPDLVAARWRVEAASRDIDAAETAFLPDISLGALAGLVNKGGDSLLQLPARFYQLAPAVSLPIFSGGRLRANLAGKNAARDLAVARYNKTLVGAINEVTDRVHALRSVAQQAEAQQTAVAAAREAWELARQRYQAGVGSFLQALGVRQQLLAAEQAAVALEARQVDLSIQLVQALGGGFEATIPPAEAPGPAAHHTARNPS